MSYSISSMTMREVEESNDKSVFVVNLTREAYPTQVIIKYQTNGGDYESLIVPPTWIPIDLAETAPKKFLMESTSLRKAYNEGKIAFVAEKEAMEILKNPDAQREMKKIKAVKDAISKATRNTIIGESEAPAMLDPVLKNAGAELNEASTQAVMSEEEQISMGIAQSILGNLLETEDEEAALDTLRNQRRFSEKALVFLSQEVPDNYRLVHEWITNNLQSAKRRDESLMGQEHNRNINIGN